MGESSYTLYALPFDEWTAARPRSGCLPETEPFAAVLVGLAVAQRHRLGGVPEQIMTEALAGSVRPGLGDWLTAFFRSSCHSAPDIKFEHTKFAHCELGNDAQVVMG